MSFAHAAEPIYTSLSHTPIYTHAHMCAHIYTHVKCQFHYATFLNSCYGAICILLSLILELPLSLYNNVSMIPYNR